MRSIHFRWLLLANIVAVFAAACTNDREGGAHDPDVRIASTAEPDLIERGRYLARAANCAACHTRKDAELQRLAGLVPSLRQCHFELHVAIRDLGTHGAAHARCRRTRP
jgi:mono/diheme cytochrome c family protein